MNMITIWKTMYRVTLLLSLSWGYTYAQQQTENGVRFNINNFTQQGKNLLVDLSFNLDNLDLKSRDQLIIKPIIKNTSQVFELPPLIINGKTRHKVYLRQKALGSLKDADNNVIEVLKGKKDELQIVSYSVVIDSEDWMRSAGLYLQESNCPGCGRANNISESFAANPTFETIPIYEPKPLLSFVTPPDIPTHSQKGSSVLKFRLGKSNIDADYKENIVELDKIHSVMKQLLHNKNLVITDLSLTGFASVEGPYALNKQLSEKRAKALKAYLIEHYRLPESLFHINWVGEDWDGLRLLVENGNMEQKEKVLDIIQSTDIFDEREKKLMSLDKGNPYRFMLNTYFPLLRKVDYAIEYTVRERSNEESKDILKTHPDYLSQKELFLLAENNGRGSDEFNNIVDVTVSLYPNDSIANLNAAAVYILRGEYEKAEVFASLSGNSSEALNNLGVIYLMQGKLKEARVMLTKAAEAGSKDAIHNLGELTQVEETTPGFIKN